MSTSFPTLQGSVRDYEILVIGHISWNRYYGEREDNRPRGKPFTCTSTLVRGVHADGTPYVLVIDPTERVEPEEFWFDLNRRSGLRPEAVTHCFITHCHGDHAVGCNCFPQAQWLAAPATIERLKGTPGIDESRVLPAEGEFLPGVCVVPLPGHTRDVHGVAFCHEGRCIVATGDAVMSRPHFRHSTCEYEEDAEAAQHSLAWVRGNADIVIPGHDNYFLVR